jgi:hypothetical protein
MKTYYIFLFVICCTFTGCNRRSDNSTDPALDSTALQSQTNYDDQLKQQKAQLDAYDAQSKRADALMTTQEQLMKRQQDDFARFEKILDTWELQQKQYQKYLDSLQK